MGQYKLWVGLIKGFGLHFKYEKRYEFIISFFFIEIHIGLMEDAQGVRIFDWEKH